METVLVTGTNRGIGLALCEALLKEDFAVIAGCRNPEAAEGLHRLKKRFVSELRIVPLDVRSEESLQAMARELDGGSIDVIVNNAAIMPEEGDESLLKLDLAFFSKTFETNVLGPLKVVQAFFPHLQRSARPRILNLSSGLGSIQDRENHWYSPYATSKAALNMLTRSMALELGVKGVTTVAISPGWVRTEMGGEEAELSAAESAESLVQAIRLLGPELNGGFLDRSGKAGVYRW